MSIARYLLSSIARVTGHLAQRRVLRDVVPADLREKLEDWPRSLVDPTGYYLDCFRYFHLCLEPELRKHRRYFSLEGRGFGEDAFHVMWWLLFTRIEIRRFAEIGVFRGQTLSLAALLQRRTGAIGRVVGISPFQAIGDSVSRYRRDVDYYSDTLRNFRAFDLPEPTLIKAYSTDPAAVDMIRSAKWDCIYIDGNHDYEIAKSDWDVAAESCRTGGVIVLDDSALYTAYQPPPFATKGHPGPSRLTQEVDPAYFREVLQVGHNRVFQKNTPVPQT